MNRELALAEWRHARDALKAAEMLTREDLSADAISRAYYAILHAAKAALHVQEVAVESHAAVKRMFGLHLIRSGAIEAEWAAHLGRSLEERLAADYDTEALFSADDAEEECRRARKFIARIRRYLLNNGIAPAELRQGPRHG
jgi:uncharacterized protein (UPF0332 family)